ncbi:MAG: DUF819 domain-containing protein [Fidelibacterota bacterium]
MMGTLITHPFGLLAVLCAIPAGIFLLADHRVIGKLFKIVPALVFAYFIPSLLSTLHIIPQQAPIFNSIKTFILPASLLLLTLAVDIAGIIRLGPKALIMFLAGTLGVVAGGPLSLWLFQSYLPSDIWKGMAALAGSWIGGGANFIAIGKSVGASDTTLGTMVIVDVVVANVWMGILLFLAGRYQAFDRWLGADNSAVEALKDKVVAFQEKAARIPTTSDYMTILALAFGGSWLCYLAGQALPPIGVIISHTTWTVILITTLGVTLSFTRIKYLEGVGASKIGTFMLYLLIGVIGAHADFTAVAEYPYLILMAFSWILVHIIVLLLFMRLLKAPLFFMAVGSQANIGGAASAPIVAAAFHPALASVGVMLGIAGYVLGTYAALICAWLLRLV